MAGAIAGRLEPFDSEVESIGTGGAVLHSKRDQGRQTSSSIPESHRTGELLAFTKYLIATETHGAAPKEADGRPERVLQAKESGYGSEVSFSPVPAAAWGVCGHILGRATKVGGAL